MQSNLIFSHCIISILFIDLSVICVWIPIGSGLDVDEYVRRAYKYAYSDCIEVGPVAFLTEPPDPNELYPRQSRRWILF